MLLLEFHDLNQGLVHRRQHLGQRVLFIPGILVAVISEIRQHQRSRVFGVGAAEDIAVGVEAEEVGHVATDIGEIGDGAVVHEDVAAEDERVAVDLRHDAAAGGADVGEQAVGFGVAAQVPEVEVADWR